MDASQLAFEAMPNVFISYDDKMNLHSQLRPRSNLYTVTILGVITKVTVLEHYSLFMIQIHR